MATPYFSDDTVTLYHGDALAVARELPTVSVDCICTSPPYFGLRSYGVGPTRWPEVTFAPMVGVPPVTVPQMQCCLGLEPDPTSLVAHLRLVFSELRRVLADDGTLWLNLGDSYAGSWGNQGHTLERSDFRTKYRDADALPARTRTGSRCPDGPDPKNLYGIPWRTAFALQEDGWTLRNAITWTKPNSMPESVHDRLASRCEMVFLFTKQPRYSFDLDAIRQPPRRPQTLDEGVVSRAATPHAWARPPSPHTASRGPATQIQPANELRSDWIRSHEHPPQRA
jgi:hypothetical protein